jgi:hypothetical protein
MKRLLLFLFLLLSSFFTSFGQTCDVKLDAIRGTYNGGCENNKANGEGKSTGTDEYEGTFKNGYPHGRMAIILWALLKKGIKMVKEICITKIQMALIQL